MSQRPTHAIGNPEDEDLLRQAEEVLRQPPGQDVLIGEYAILLSAYRSLSRKFAKTLRIADNYHTQAREMALRLEQISAKFRQLRSVAMPICVHCRKVRSDNDDYWEKLENYLARNADIMFAQGVCPECRKLMNENLGQTAEPALTARPPRKKVPPAEDESIIRLRELAAKSGLPEEESSELAKFVENYAKQSRRFAKTLTISDSYQAQLRDLNIRLEMMARTDLLTGLANRWEMSNRLEAEHSRMLRYDSPFSIILGDVDHFKEVNDTYGHQAGDCVLRRLAKTMRNNLRSEDLCARWGGEEFLILLPETELPAALLVAGKLCRLVAETRTRFDGRTVGVTMSFGVASSSPDLSIDACLKLADDAMYEAKKAGRNQVAAARKHDPTLPAPNVMV